MGVIAIVGYRPKSGKESELRELVRTHVDVLRKQGLATDRQSIIMRAKDGTIVEVFEWVAGEAIKSAHSNDEVNRMWAEYAAVCDYVPVADLPETSAMFSEFTSLDL
ncbi:MAG: hypothetical protein DWQ47_07220 [Acidobacteria bacterium]|nr:MAG: hypothetical protein DWQ32_15320 [Acidobacteriota bacterium]REJ99284.1 MAG: hypothetical protein DWQ38_14655 [Acidobacteriota bacterium]REK15995.1 MAG: hypothetical protein DWQ43_03030 [Acidobacteriota bacterium]REK43676.1 MAG: hypothetical protein DWQ47_07220 [Acidobacteriota bacterium]